LAEKRPDTDFGLAVAEKELTPILPEKRTDTDF
jgi:hypothetical protein